MATVITTFEEYWITHFWYPKLSSGDKAFGEGEFKEYMDCRAIKFESVYLGRNSRTAI